MLCCVPGVAAATRGSVEPSLGERATAPGGSTTVHAERRCRKRTCNARAAVLRSIFAGRHHHTRRARAIPVTVASRAYRTGAPIPSGISSQPATASRRLRWCVPATATRRTAALMEKYDQLWSVPEPYLGYPDTPVVLLNLNPGGEKRPSGWQELRQEDEIARARDSPALS